MGDKNKFVLFCEDIYDLQEEFNFSVTSWFRTEKRNKAVGGKPNSKHLTGLGLDIVFNNMEDESLKGYFKDAVKAKGLVAIDEGDHIHIQTPKEQ